MDLSSIAAGENWSLAIKEALSSSEVVLAVVGKAWVRELHRSRTPGELDFVRAELSEALARDLKVLLVRVDGAPLPRAHQLPAELQPLLETQEVELTESRYEDDFERLVAAIGGARGAVEVRLRGTGRGYLVLSNQGPFAVFVDGVRVGALAVGETVRTFKVPAGRHFLQAAVMPAPEPAARLGKGQRMRAPAQPALRSQRGPDNISNVPSERIPFEVKGGKTVRFEVSGERASAGPASGVGLVQCALQAIRPPVRP
jgi:hypothetical protein